MNNAQVINTQFIFPMPSNSPIKHLNGLAVWKRLLIALGMLVVAACVGFCVWVFGMLMFTFSLDGANRNQLPAWLDVFMLIGWPVSIGLSAFVPSILLACGTNLRWVVGSLVGTGLTSFAVFMVGVVTVFTALA